ncbi:MAG: Kelch-like protein 1, partial [Acidobacteria bacterium]|nr:Kelch-like protein 1 [Acidobacteriota bacterium]
MRHSVLIAALVASAAVDISCQGSSTAVPDPSSHDGVKLLTSKAAAAVVDRLKAFHVKQPVPPFGHRQMSAGPILARSEVLAARVNENAIRAEFAVGRGAEAVYPTHANDVLKLTRAGTTIPLSLQGTTDANAEYADGYIVYREALSGGGDMVIRPTRDGFEDHFLFDKRPRAPVVDYLLALPPSVAGLRLNGNVLELLDGNGTPLVHASSPFVVDAEGKTTTAVVSISGCEVDRSPQPPWGRKPTPPGASQCHILVSWDDSSLTYPALLDPNWTTAGSMSVGRGAFASAVMTQRTPQYIVAAGGFSPEGRATTLVEFFDANTETWSTGPSMQVARAGITAVYHNSTGTSAGDEVFVSGGTNAQWGYESTTELLSVDAAGNFQWSLSAPMRTARAAHTSTLVGGNQILIAGGGNASGVFASCELFNFSTHAFESVPPPDMRQPRANASAALLGSGQSVLLTGGFNDISDTELPPTAEVFSAGQWIAVPDMPSQHAAHTSVTLKDGTVLVMGGLAATNPAAGQVTYSNTAEIFSYQPTPPHGTWRSVGPFSATGRTAPATVLPNGAVLLASGASKTGEVESLTTEASLFDPRTNVWTRTDTSVTHQGGGAAQFSKPDGTGAALLFGGWISGAVRHGISEK